MAGNRLGAAARRGWRAVLVLGVLAASPGCMTCLRPVPCPPEQVLAQRTVPQASRDSVYIFLVNGIDPLDAGNLAGLREYLYATGYPKVYHGQLYHTGRIAAEIRRLRRVDPDARFVLIGHGAGAAAVHSLARGAAAEGIPPDLVVLLAPGDLDGEPGGGGQSTGAARVLSVTGDNLIWDSPDVPGADTLHIQGVGPYALPTHQATLETLARELTAVAERVPIVIPDLGPAPPLVTPAPPPRPVQVKADGPPDEWDFLKPRDFPGFEPPVGTVLPPEPSPAREDTVPVRTSAYRTLTR